VFFEIYFYSMPSSGNFVKYFENENSQMARDEDIRRGFIGLYSEFK